MTTQIKDCVHRFTTVVEHGGDACNTCSTEWNADRTVRPPEPVREIEIDGRKVRTLARRSKIGTKHLMIDAEGITGQWAMPRSSMLGKNWLPGEIAFISLGGSGWRAYFGDFSMTYADDLALMKDVVLAVRYLAGQRPLDFPSPPVGELETMADALGVRLPRLMFRGGQTVTHSTSETLADFLVANLKPKAAGPLNLRASRNQQDGLPDGIATMPDGRMLAT